MVNWAKIAEEREKKISEMEQRIDELTFEKSELETKFNELEKEKVEIETMWKEKPVLEGDSAEQISELEMLIGSLQSENRMLRQNQSSMDNQEIEKMKGEVETMKKEMHALETEKEKRSIR